MSRKGTGNLGRAGQPNRSHPSVSFSLSGCEITIKPWYCSIVQIPSIAPPPPMVMPRLAVPDEAEALSSMLMAWYMSGYHTGYYQVDIFFTFTA